MFLCIFAFDSLPSSYLLTSKINGQKHMHGAKSCLKDSKAFQKANNKVLPAKRS